jgi:hypothetical protein
MQTASCESANYFTLFWRHSFRSLHWCPQSYRSSGLVSAL